MISYEIRVSIAIILMSIIDDIEAILNIHEEHRSRAKNWEPSTERQLGLTVEQENKMVL